MKRVSSIRLDIPTLLVALLWMLAVHGPVVAADPDAIPPSLLRAGNSSEFTIRLTFTEPLAAAGANNPANFAVNGGIKVTEALLSDNTTNVTLTVSALTLGETYVVTVQNLTDLADPPNSVAAGNTAAFVAMELLPQGVGYEGGQVQRVASDSFNVTGGGTDIGGSSDRFQFASQTRTGNFDVQVRVAGIAPLSSPFVHAGLMARSASEINSPFAAVFSSSPQFGCFFELRPTAGAIASQQTLSGGFPVNDPWTYLRLRRSGNQFTGFGSHDGRIWIQLGTATLAFPSSLQVGLAVCSQNANETATAQFREYGPTRSQTTGTYKADREPIGPSSRRTGLIFSEIHYHPRSAAGVTNNMEFVELYNTGPVFEDLTGWRISGGIDYHFPAGTKIPAGGFLVVAADPAALEKAHALTGVLGPFGGALNDGGDTLRLRDHVDAIRIELTYDSRAPWPVAAAGAGHSLLLTRASYGENDPRAWGISERVGGSPGRLDAVLPAPYRGVVINEFLAHTDDPQLDFIELYNHSNTAVDLSGCSLTDDPSTNRFKIAPGTVLGPRSFIAWDQNQLGFRLNAAGETLFLFNPEGTQVVDAVRFEGQENGVSTGRSPDGSSTFRRLATPTSGAANAPWRQEEIVLSEIMYHPITGDSADEYLEFFNRGTVTLDLGSWRLTRGVSYQIPAGIRLAPGQYLVVAKDVARLRSKHAHLNAANSAGNFSGTLSDSRDHVALSKPIALISTNAIGDLVTNVTHAVIAETAYFGGGRWGYYSDGGGSSLELIDPNADPLRPSNWADSDETRKAAWETVEFTGPLDNGLSQHVPNRFRISMLGAGECLIDDVEILKVGSTNLIVNTGFENGATGWSFQGNHSASFVQTNGAFSGNNCLHVIGQGDGDTGVNAIRVNILSGAAGLAAGNNATIRAKVRWQAGWPEVLFRTRGNWIELPARMTVPSNLGTPGKPNSRLVANAGPAIYEVTHTPALPRANQPVVVTCRVSDPDGFGGLRLRFRVDPATTSSEVAMRDDGSGGDEIAGDGVYSGTIAGRSGGTIVAFVISAADGAASSATAIFPAPGAVLPAATPTAECLIRWDDPQPAGSFGHYHLWNTQLTQSRRGNALDNMFRDCTLVYGDFRVIYNAGFRDKGSPFHGGGGDYAVTVPRDELLLGAADRVFGSTGNGGSEETGVRGRISAWIGAQMGIPYLHAHFVRVYRNGNQHQNISEDLEQPNHSYAENQFPGLGGEGDLHKIAIWFEFQDDNRSFDATSATLERFTSRGGLKLGRYRWNWQRRPKDGTANNLTNVFELVAAANATTDYSNRLLQLADMEEWMGVFAFHRILGNWDSYNYSVGQNMFAYKVTGDRWRLLPWDIDFVLGLGDGATAPLGAGTFGGGSQDPIATRFFNDPAFRRSLWRSYITAVNGPLLVENYSPQIAARRNALLQNGVSGLSSTNTIYSYINSRRNYINTQLRNNDTNQIVITSNGGADFTTSTPTTTLVGLAPFAAATIEVNGIPYPVTWTSQRNFSIVVPLTQATNRLVLSGVDLHGIPLTNAPAVVTAFYTGQVEQSAGQVVLNEIQYNPQHPSSSFIELYNNSATTPFDLSNYRLDGAGYTFPEGAIIPRNGYLVLASDRRGFAEAYGNLIPVFDVFAGSLDNGGEHLRLVQPGVTGAVVSDVRYDDQLPWPRAADGFGPSLQLIDPTHGSYRVANWSAASTNDSVLATPGRVNSVRLGLPLFPNVWLNEVLPQNVSGPADNASERDPFVELHNPGSEAIDLAGLYLTDNFTNLTQWAFPSGASIGPKGFLVVWLDAQPHQSSASALHANFRPNPTNGPLALVRLQGPDNSPAVIDFLEYRLLPVGRSFGSYPDGEPRDRRSFTAVTPGGSNNPGIAGVKLSINEFMAGNTNSIIDPADGARDDWFELFNGGTASLDLTSYRLTDSSSNATRFIIPPGYVIPPGGYLLVWADGETKQNTSTNADLHANFKLALSGGYLGLFSPDGNLVDGFSYGPQKSDVSSGRYPDGTPGPIVTFDVATPRAANFLSGGNRPPSLAAIPPLSGTEQTLIAFSATASDPDAGQKLTFSLGADAPAGASIDLVSGRFQWTPEERQGPGSYFFTLRVADDGTPSRTSVQSVSVTVLESNRAPVVEPSINLSVDEGAILISRIPATDPDLPAQQLRFTLEPNAPPGMEIDPNNGDLSWTPSEADGPGVFRVGVRIVDNGSPPLSASTTLLIAVNEVNNPPVIEPILPQTIDENSAFTLAVRAFDPDDRGAALDYSLDGNPPAGMTIDSLTGVLSWKPTELQGPASHVILVRVTERNSPQLSSVRNFGVTVREVNQLPVLAAIGDFVVEEGERVAFTAAVTDLDLPPQRHSFSLAPGGPKEAGIDQNTGVFEWIVPSDAGASTNTITVRVADDAPDSPGDSKTFSVIVRPRFSVGINEILYRPSGGGSEFIELLNRSAITRWDLSGFRLVGKKFAFTFPAGTVLAPGALTCVVRDVNAFRIAYGAKPVLAGIWTGALGVTEDDIRLMAPGNAGEILDRVVFRATPPWPGAANGAGASLQVIDAALTRSRVANWAASENYAGPRSLLTITNTWKFFQSGPLDAVWKTPAFNDSSWRSGSALLYVEEAALSAPKNTALTLGQNTYYFRANFVLPTVPKGASLVLSNIIDDGAVFYLNGVEVHRQGLDPGPVDFNSVGYDFRNPKNAVSDASWAGPIALPLDALVAGTNIFAVEVHQVSATSSDVVFGCTLNLEGGTIASFSPGESNNVAAKLPVFPDLWINEVLPNNTSGLADNRGEREPWIELINVGGGPASLDGMFLSTSYGVRDPWPFPSGITLPPGGLLVVFADAEPGDSSTAEPHTNFRLDPNRGSVVLSRIQAGAHAVLDYLDYDAVPPNASVASVPDGQGFARGVFDRPTPGSRNGPSPNAPPVLSPLPLQFASPGEEWSVILTATDPDADQALVFSLDPPMVAGAVIDARTGRLVWKPTRANLGTNAITVRVTDNGTPPLSVVEKVPVVVTDGAAPVLTAAVRGDRAIVLQWTARLGVRYEVEAKNELSETAWRSLGAVTATSNSAVFTDPADPLRRHRYYRIVGR